MRYLFLFSILLFQLFQAAAQPIAVCQNYTAYIGLAGFVSINATAIDNGSTGATIYSINGGNNVIFTCADLGSNAVTLTISDSLGVTASCMAVVTVLDTLAPVVVVQPRTVFINSSGTVTVFSSMFNMSSTDNCAIASATVNGQGSLTFTCADLGINNISVGIMDNSGNLSTAITTVTVIDTFSAVLPALCRTDTLLVYLGINDSASIQSQEIYTGLQSFCWSFGISPSSFSIADIGFNTVQLVASNGSSNDTCTSVVQVIDTAVVEIHGRVLYTTDSCLTGIPVPYMAVELQPLGLLAFTNTLGEYYFIIPATDTYTLALPYIPSHQAPKCPIIAQQTVIAGSFAYYGNIDFFLGTSSSEHDVAINFYGGNYRIGVPRYKNISVHNLGVYSESGIITYITDDSISISNLVLGSNISWLSTSGDTTYFTYNNLPAGAQSSIHFSALVAPGTPLNTSIQDCAYINISGATDEDMSNNNICRTGPVVNSYDPNEKTVTPFHAGNQYDGTILPTDEVLDYTIHFQNTGNAEAITVELRDTLSGYLLPNTMHHIASSHDCEISVEQGNILVIRFEDIYLPDSTSDYMGSMGFFHFSIHRNSNLPLGTVIENSASIYFDFNAPILTNTARSTISLPLAIENLQEKPFHSWVAPNPVQNVLNLSYQLDSDAFISVQLVNTLGEVVAIPMQSESHRAGAYSTAISMQSFPAGLYFLRVVTEKGQEVHRVVKN